MDWFWVVVVVCVAIGAWVLIGAAEKAATGAVGGVLKLAGVGDSRAKWAKGIVFAALVGFFVFRHFGGGAADGVEKSPVGIQPAVMATAGGAAQEKRAPADCSCASGATCTGPRGGQYCLTDGGNKRYR